ncbi:MAG: NAD-dependent epimerase/dehydratase family protein [Candidatus Limnocylindrales bacterium]
MTQLGSRTQLPGRVLVTGGAGFVGATVVRRLASAGIAVRILDDGRAAGFAALEGAGAELIAEDVLVSDLAVALAGVDAIVHLAAQTNIQASLADPVGDLRVNVEGTLRLLEAARTAGVPRFVFASSASVIGPVDKPANETTLPRPAVPYGAGKLAAEAYLHAYFATYGMVTTSLRFANVYGPFARHKQSVVPRFIRAALAGEPLIVYGDGGQTRDFVHVEDLAELIAAVLAADSVQVGGRVFHGASGRETTVRRLAELVLSFGPDGGRIEQLPERRGDVAHSCADIALARSMLGYAPRMTLEVGLAATMDWFRADLIAARSSVALAPEGRDMVAT